MSPDVHGLVGAFAVDAIDDEERAAFAQHLGECPECQAEVANLREAAAHLSHLSETAPPAALRARVLADIRTVRPLPPLGQQADDTAPDAPTSSPDESRTPATTPPSNVVQLHPRRRQLVTWLAGAAASILLVGGLVWSPWDDPSEGTPTQQVLAAKDAQRYEKVIDGARATIVRSASLGKAVIIADNMPSAPAGKDFQVWFDLPDRGMVSAGVMPHGSAPTLTMLLEGDAASATGAGITVEPAGGSPAPTTDPVALFAFS